jgi:UDP-N-acetylmuramoyl-tripeptide--D-alanyl-D-alanine ligase
MKISIDSRTIQPGDYFIPVKGRSFNGQTFISEAIEKGGRLLDVDIHTYTKKYRKKLKCHVIAITGSAGKTTTKDLLAAILSQKYNVVKTHENQNNEFGVPLTVLSASDDTEILIVEMGMRKKGDIDFLTNIVRPTHVVVTNIGVSHIEFFKNQKGIASAKSEIFKAPLKWETNRNLAFINFSSPYHDLLTKKATKTGYGIIGYSGETYTEATINLCYEIGHHFSVSDDEIEVGIASFESSSHRLIKKVFKGALLIDDTYNSNPDGVTYALEHLKKYPGRKLFVFGDMLELGSVSDDAHQAIVEQSIEAGVSLLCTYGNCCKKMKSDSLPMYHFEDKATLGEFIKMEIKDGDTVLIKGSRGLKMETIIEGLENDVS